MGELRFTLISDGTSDRCLLQLLRWLLIRNGVARPIQGTWADLARLRHPQKRLHERIGSALQFYPCDLLLIHRDSETKSPSDRKTEIQKAVRQASTHIGHLPPTVCIIPVRMSEAWFLFDESAIRVAAGNPCGRTRLRLPRTGQIESIPDPKERLYALIRAASELSGRRLRKLDPAAAVHRLADIIDDYSPLRALPAFAALEAELSTAIANNGWNTG